MRKRIAIVASGETWEEAPFSDPDVTIISLNDSYVRGLPRFDAWYEVHPLDRIIESDDMPCSSDIPHGWFHRPTGYMEWLASLDVPVYVQGEPRWPHAIRYPLEQVTERFGRYLTSGPALMLAHVLLGYPEWIGIYGCSMTGGSEYAHQRPCMERLIGRAEERGIEVVIPDGSGLMKSSHIYAFENFPAEGAAEQAHRETMSLNEARERTILGVFNSPLRWIVPGIGKAARLDAEMRTAHRRYIALSNREMFGTPH